MSVPESIRAVPRPKNTVVVDSGHEGVLRYAVRERAGVKYGPGGRSRPVNGRVIGHIIDGEYVPIIAASEEEPAFLSFGPSAFVNSMSTDLYQDLQKVFAAPMAQQIMVIASIKAMVPSVRCSRLNTEYESSWISVYYPATALGRNTVGRLLKFIGMNSQIRRDFFGLRLARVQESHHLIIDSTLKTDSSSVSDFPALSTFSRKARVEGCEGISLLYAYDLENGEPICSQAFPGDCIDAMSYHSFIAENNIGKGCIVDDKGFPISAIAEDLKAHASLYSLTPLKLSDKRVCDNRMLDFEETLPGFTSSLYGKKAGLADGRFLYSFRDEERAALEEKSLSRSVVHGQSFDKEKYWEKREALGSIVFESDQNLPLAAVYKICETRRDIELLSHAFKNEACPDEANVKSICSVIGGEFINFVAMVLTHRMIQAAREAGLLEEQTFGELMRDISHTFRLRKFKDKAPVIKDRGWAGCMPQAMADLAALGLCGEDPTRTPKEAVTRIVGDGHPRKPGRPGKWPKPVGDFVGPKRPRGRPRKSHEPS